MLKIISRIIITCFTLQMALAQTKPYLISRFTQENGMNFENQGPLHTMNFYEKTLNICNDLTIAYEGVFKTTCDNFKLTSNSLEQVEQEVSRKRFYMLQSIDETDIVTRQQYLLKIIEKQTNVLKATANTFKEENQMEAQINRFKYSKSNSNTFRYSRILKLTQYVKHNNCRTRWYEYFSIELTLYHLIPLPATGASELPCEVKLFVKPSSIPISCPIHNLDSTRSIYHRLKYQNAWMYIIKTTDNVAVSCEHRYQALNILNIQLTGNGSLTLNED
ncbi:Uncharacterized protein FWK35_00020614 [Aphis craccivora]|uniref:Envelope fusion protein n=1 Tax=Aphis craccivora TaxID=307492 RepID=A0A6G0XDX7_APHCR|nr:Uncharacterized protein FWK35_00020614 [Aphis craccivora]